MTKPFQIDFSISAGACIGCCFLLLLLPLNVVFSVFFAAAIHELCHIGVLFFLQIPILRFEVGVNGATVCTAPLPPLQELVCSAAGPVGSFLCLLFLRTFPLFALCGCVQGLYNLLPVYPLDGGRMLRCICLLFFPRHTYRICLIGRRFAFISVIAAFMSLFYITNDPFYIAPLLYFTLQTLHKEKSLAKSCNIEYNKADF